MKTAQAVLHGYSTLKAEDMLAPLSPTFTHQVLPASLNMPTRDIEAFKIHAGRIGSIFSTFKMVPQRMFEDPEKNSVIIYAKMIGELTQLGPWENECFMTLRMSQNGEKVEEITEFVDSAKAKLLHERLTWLGKANVMRDGKGSFLKGINLGLDKWLLLGYVLILVVFLFARI
jgi:hypothetical protein